MGLLLNESFTAVVGDVTKPDAELVQELAQADIIIDASASVAVSRHLADLEATSGRRVSLFFNPTGTAVVLLAESADRSVTLRDLEAQYHRLVQTDPALKDHLSAAPGLRYSGSCRALTNRIPATNAALLSAHGARGFVEALKSDEAAVRVWKLTAGGGVGVIEHQAARPHRVAIGAWTITYDDGLLSELARLRDSRLPRETGGVLLGIADFSRESIHVVQALPEPEDSRGSPEGFAGTRLANPVAWRPARVPAIPKATSRIPPRPMMTAPLATIRPPSSALASLWVSTHPTTGRFHRQAPAVGAELLGAAPAGTAPPG
jgi:hypothetical protein